MPWEVALEKAKKKKKRTFCLETGGDLNKCDLFSPNLIFILYWSIVDLNAMLTVSGVQQSESVIHIHISFFSDSFPI